MGDMFVVGLTGGIGTGKTEVSKLLQELGAAVVDADKVAHEVYRRGAPGWHEVVAEFGERILAPDGEVDRAKLGDIVFADRRALKRLNAIVHPKVRSMIEARLRDLRGRGEGVVVIEAGLLIEARQQETRWASLVDEIWMTIAPEGQVVKRVQGRSRLEAEAVWARIRSQMPQDERIAHADVVIDNSGGLWELRERVRALWDARVPNARKRQI